MFEFLVLAGENGNFQNDAYLFKFFKKIDFPSLFSPVLRSCLCLHFFLFFLLMKFEKKEKDV